MEKDLKDLFKANEHLNDLPQDMSPGVMAYLGDAVYELYIRTRSVSEGCCRLKDLHSNTIKMVKAQTQMDAALSIMDCLTDEEIRIFKRGRNIRSYNTPKNASVSQYRHATGFEALVGYLFINNRFDRLNEVLDMAYDSQLG